MSERDVITEELDLVTQNLCAMMLHAEVTEVDGDCVEWGSRSFHSTVMIHGDWSGQLDLTTSAAAAQLMARSLFGCAKVNEQQCLEAVREVSNILAGNIKSALPGITRLAIPEVGTQPAEGPRARSNIVSMFWQFGSPAELFSVSVSRGN